MTTPVDQYTETLLVGLAELLDTAGAGTFSSSDPYDEASEQPMIVLIELPQAPERLICLTDYPVDDDPESTG